MAITKNKIQLLDKILSVEAEMDTDYWCNWWNYSYENYNYSDCDCSECNNNGYWGQCIYEGGWGYLNDVFDDRHIVTTGKSWKRLSNNGNIIIGKMIDMNSIYSRERLREKKINQVLGLESASYHKATIGDFFPKEN